MDASNTDLQTESHQQKGEEIVSVTVTVNASGCSKQIKDAYDRYLEEDLPRMGWSRPHAGKYDSEAYKVGLQRFQKDYKRMVEQINGTEGLRLNPYMDLDMCDCLGEDLYDDGRREEDELRLNLASFKLTQPGGSWMWPSPDCHFELVQQDVKIFARADDSSGAAFLLKCTAQSKSGKLRGAEVHLSIDESEGFEFLDVSVPPGGAEIVAPHDIGGIIEFKESESWGGLFVEHQTFGAMSCGMLGSKQAFVKLYPDQGTQEVNCLSAIVLVCLSDTSGLEHNMSLSVEASLSHAGVLKGWRKSNHMHKVGVEKVQLSTDSYSKD